MATEVQDGQPPEDQLDPETFDPAERTATTGDDTQAAETAVIDPLPAEQAAGDDGSRLARLREQLGAPMPADRLWGWVSALVVTAIGGVLRFWDLSRPHRFAFDETYYAKDAWSLMNHGVARDYVDGANEKILAGNLDVYKGSGSFIVHPEVGKWIIGLGERTVAMDPFGWRVGVAVVGTLSVLLLTRIARRLFRSTLLGAAAGLLLALDGLAVVLSRTALLDGILMFFLLAAVGALLLDRDWSRARYVAWASGRGEGPYASGPVQSWRPWRLVAGVCFGLACGTKWNAVFVLAVFGVVTVLWDGGARKALGVKGAYAKSLVVDGPFAFLTIVVTAVVVYVASWAGWIATSSGYDRSWAATREGSGWLGSIAPSWLRSLWHYHAEMLNFHTHLDTPHRYASKPWDWLTMWRPVSFDYVESANRQGSCGAARCSQEVLALGTPAIWWAGCIATLVCVALWFVRRDWRAGVAVLGVAATWLPWFLWLDRTAFSFYAIITLPFLILAIVYVLGLLLGPKTASPVRRGWGSAVVGLYLLLVVVNSAWLYPILTDQVLPHQQWYDRMWFNNWI